MTDFLSKISPRVRENAKAWFEAAGLPEGAEISGGGDKGNLPSKAAFDKAFENLKLLASLYAEGVPAREVSALNLLFAQNPRVSVAALIHVAREKRADPTLAPWLKLLKETLLPKVATTEVDSEEIKKAKAKQVLDGAKLIYESGAIAHTLSLSLGLGGVPHELQSGLDRYEAALGRKLNEEEKFA